MSGARLCALLVCLTASAVRPVSADVLVVDPADPTAYQEIQPAIDAAAEGDVILVAPGPLPEWEYDGFVIVGKALSVVALGDGGVAVAHAQISDLPAGGAIVLDGLDIARGIEPGPAAPALQVLDCDGALRVQRCRIGSSDNRFEPVRVSSSADVTIVDCEITGETADDAEDGTDAFHVLQSAVRVFSSTLRGSEGGYDETFGHGAFGGDGGAALVLDGGSLWASASSMAGGDGGDGAGVPGDGGNGGPGLVVSSGTAAERACRMQGGHGGEGDFDFGLDGPGVVGELTSLTPPARLLEIAAVAQEGATVAFLAHGEVGDRAHLLVSARTTARSLGLEEGAIHVDLPIVDARSRIGVIPAGRILEGSLKLPLLPDGDVLQWYLQIAFESSSGELRFGDVRVLTLLDSAYAERCAARMHVDRDAAPGGDGRGWATAFTNLETALSRARTCTEHPAHEIWIAEGEYRPAGPGGDRARSFYVRTATSLLGGFAGTETDADQRDPALHRVVLSGDLDGNDGPDFTFRDDNSFHVVESGRFFERTSDVLLDGLEIRGGHAHSTTLSRGGAVHLDGDAALVRCVVRDNGAGSRGGGVHARGGVRLESVRFLGNRAADGGAVYHIGVPIGSRLELSNCELVGNRASQDGGAVWVSHPWIQSSTFAGNSAGDAGGALWCEAADDADPRIWNSVLYGNTDASGSGELSQIAFELSVPVVDLRYSCVEGWTGALGGVGNFGADPLFVDLPGADGQLGTIDDDARLGAGSPCVDAAENASVAPDRFDLDGDGDTIEPVPEDVRSLPRFTDDPTVPDTGSGTPPIVDAGAHERAGV